MTLASRSAPPLTRLNTPNAVPRNSAGAVFATSFDNRPCVSAMCTPHSAAPTKTSGGDAAAASTRSATMSSASPTSNSVRWLTRSAAIPAG